MIRHQLPPSGRIGGSMKIAARSGTYEIACYDQPPGAKAGSTVVAKVVAREIVIKRGADDVTCYTDEAGRHLHLHWE